jgi:Flp pilus assembly pilin Flp
MWGYGGRILCVMSGVIVSTGYLLLMSNWLKFIFYALCTTVILNFN